MVFNQGHHEVFICQKKMEEILKKFKLERKEMSTTVIPKEKLCKEYGIKMYQTYLRSMIGCMMNLTVTHPDILNYISILSWFMHFTNEKSFKVARRVFGYVKDMQFWP